MLERQAMCSACLFLQRKGIMLDKHLKKADAHIPSKAENNCDQSK